MTQTIAAWASLWPTFLLALLLIFGLGLPLTWSVGARGLVLWAVSPVVSGGVIAAAAVGMPLLGVSWGLWALLSVWACLVAVAVIARLVLFRRASWGSAGEPFLARRRSFGGSALGLLIGAGLLAGTVGRVIGSPENFAQRFDNIFHLNAIRYVLDTGNASPFWVGTLVSGDTPPGFYPSGWHALVSLLAETQPGISIPAAVNVATIVICAVVWTSGVVLLGRVVAGPRLVVGVMSGVAAAAFSAFPLFFLEWGTLYPNLYGFSFMPAVMALILMVCRAGQSGRDASAKVVWALLILTLPGLALVHPSALLFTTLLFASAVVVALLKGIRGFSGRQLQTRILLAIVVVAGLCAVWWKVRTPVAESSRHNGRVTLAQGLGEWIANAPVGHAFALVISVAVFWGIAKCWKHDKTLILWWAATGIMYLFTASLDAGLAQEIREILAGGFYTDQYRVAALTAITGVPLAIVGLTAIFDAFAAQAMRRVHASESRTRRRIYAMILLLFTAASVASTQLRGVQDTAGKVTEYFRYTPAAEILTGDERNVLDHVSELVPAGATIIVNPGTGAAFAYALSDRRVTEPAILNVPTPAEMVLRESLDQVGVDPEVCAAVRSMQAYYVLDFGDGNTWGTAYARGYQGFEDLDSAHFDVLYQVGTARLLRIEGCQ